ncbi:CatB-related O-acetyltransferase [Paraglaciecola chathamensis]|uniref:CatB-related O-acetyltransferase n=1 Tax=Paraglaciecola chathamensis TaxID=368405 RepID=A0ABS0W9E8_9ALTE|nr:CatB-related O-acetyltransferase [Paraglaciecola chathamensis]MBJ2135415.1 CatB-related O-acetyltransferase [Paraglaciecola chathamensis]
MLRVLYRALRSKLVTLYVIFKNRNCVMSYDSNLANNNIFGYQVKIADKCRVFASNIGDYSYLADNVSLNKCKIGKFCSIGPSSKINLGNHPINAVSTSPSTYSETTSKEYSRFIDVTIGNDVWIGADVKVCGGVTIGHGAVIGACSYINQNVPPYAVVVGIPGKIIKYRFDEKTISKLIKLSWWDWPVDKIKDIASAGGFDNVQAFIKKN